MLNSIPLKCSNCGANLQITPEMETFACGYCGASQIVQRTGGTVSLRLLSEGIKQVQVGTDKTAAELAIRRLKEEHQSLQQVFNQLTAAEKTNAFEIARPFKIGGGALSFICFIVLFYGGTIAVLSFLFWFAGIIALVYFYLQQSKQNFEDYQLQKQQLHKQSNEILARIQTNKKIVDS